MIVVTGAGGNLGRLVAVEIARQGAAAAVRLGTRTPDKLGDLARQGFDVVHADFDDAHSLRSVFDGAQTVLLISTDMLDSANRSGQHRAAVDAAKKAGVARVIYTSFVNATASSHFPAAASHADTEIYLKASGLGYTILRVNQYFENLDGALTHAKSSGTLALPGAHGKAAYISRSDVATAAVGALFGKNHDRKVYELTGPEALDLAEIAAALSAAIRRPVEAMDLPADVFAQQLNSMHLPQPVIGQLLGLYAATGAGEYATVSADAAVLSNTVPTRAAAYMQKFSS